MKKIFGKTEGIKASMLKEIEALYYERTPADAVILPETAEKMAKISKAVKRQIALLINRNGNTDFVIVGTNQQIMIPDLSGYRGSSGRLRGLRCVHTHLKINEPLSEDDITDLALLRLDLMCALSISQNGDFDGFFYSYIIPGEDLKEPYYISKKLKPQDLFNDCTGLINSIENQLSRKSKSSRHLENKEKAILINVSDSPLYEAEKSLDELKALSQTAGVVIVDEIIQRRKKPDPKFLMGKGKINQLSIKALNKGASILIFDTELTPSQINAISNVLEIKVIDRTQLILDIFASRAQTREGKIQVALAQQKYLLPRLIIQKSSAFSRLAGGIGGRGPGETKLETDRRHARDRINRLEKELKKVQKNRKKQRAKRERSNIPVISIVGYTNSGKSTLLNTLTKSHVLSEDKLFATLDPTSRRLRFPREREVIITDTVGFIKDLPKELKVAFRATLEELESADILLHVVDLSNPHAKNHIDSVNKILEELNLLHTPQVLALNKKDLVNPEIITALEKKFKGFAISARKRESLDCLYNILDKKLDELKNLL
ncbi:MAG: GTPase HflX [Deltaproteobacteria bacterium]|nr:MAG: GTPase HflX [Deltaproteobacteria bacterium]